MREKRYEFAPKLCSHVRVSLLCRRRRARVPVPPASPGTRDPPGGARTVLRLRPLTLDVAPACPRSSTRTHPLGPVPWLGLRDDQEGPTTPPIPPHPERSTDGPWLGPDDNYPTTTTAGAPHRSQRRCHLVHDNHAPSLGRSTDGTWPDRNDNDSDDNYRDDNYREDRDDNYLTSRDDSADRPLDPGHSTDGTWPGHRSRSPTHQGGIHERPQGAD